ncbi:OmpA family protein [Amylibacter sp. SFDW26]|uniref:OmpA family protein n=1 Tax=Amylibacter sp. SFDW26 TaxID=2652722 RepID=UPI001262827E|nr:OmpA family protein [Amylibacter sp. SFDW26]KAB7610497.1 OmpA family protein [Amylibacter sp. SFDW26]
MQFFSGNFSTFGCILILLANPAYSQTDAPDPLDPFDPKWDENLAPFERLEIVSNVLGLTSGGQALVNKATTFEGATAIFADPTGFGFTVGLSGDYLFDFDKASLKPEAKKALEEVLEMYADYGGTNVTVEGHTDSKGSNAYNQKLSVRRASTVENWFVENGIEKRLLRSRGLGETTPVAKNSINGRDNPEGRALNRRVEIKVKTTKKVNHLPIASGAE